MFFLRNNVINGVNKMFKNKRFFSNCNNECNLDIETKKKIQIMFIMTPSLYILSVANMILTIVSIFKK